MVVNRGWILGVPDATLSWALFWVGWREIVSRICG